MKTIHHTARLVLVINTVSIRRSDPTLKTVGYGT